MTIIEQGERMLDIPSLPLWMGSSDNAVEAVTVAFISDIKKSITGKLLHCKYSENRLLLLNDENGKEESITFDEIAYLQFSATTKFPPDQPATIFQNNSIELPGQNKPFKLKLVNDHVIEGEMKSYRLDSAGAHIYNTSHNEIIRYFVPHSAITESKLGDKIGEELLENNVVTAKHVSKALHDQAIYKNKKIGEYLVEKNIITDADLEKILRIQSSPENSKKNLRIGDIIVSEKILSRRQIDNALDIQQRKRDEKIGDILIGMGYASSLDIQRTLAKNLCMPLIKIDEFFLDEGITKLLPYELAQKDHIFPLEIVNGRLIIACYNPLDRQALNEVSRITNYELEVLIATREGVDNAIRSYYGSNVLAADIQRLEKFHFDCLFEGFPTSTLTDSQLEQGSSGPVINFLDDVLFDALAKNAAAIHFIPGSRDVELNYLIGGKLFKQLSFHKALLSLVLARLRVAGGMEFPAIQVPQEGNSSVLFKNERKAFQISILPTVHGSSIALRFSREHGSASELEDLEYDEQGLEALKRVLEIKDGLILFTSPSQTDIKTTMYAVLRYLHKQGRNITAIEDFSEQSIDGISQLQTASLPGYSAEQLLRHVQRFAPDTIMLGDIGTQSFKAALESAFKQLQLLARVYKPGPKAAVDFLKAEGLDSGFIEQHVKAIITILPVALLCDQCLAQDEVVPDLKAFMQAGENEIFYRGTGCMSCNDKGYIGYKALLHVLPVPESGNKSIIELTDSGLFRQEMRKALLELARIKKVSLPDAYKLLSNN